MNKRRRKMMSAAVVAMSVLVAGRTLAGSLDPTNAPGPTMHTLEEIYQKVAVNQTLSPNTTLVAAGNYAATNLTQVDADLVAANIKTNVTIFGIAGTLISGPGNLAPVPKTGQTTPYQTGDDGYYVKGVASPSPRFTVQADTNCVMDNLTGLVWARNANKGGSMTWSNAIVYCEALNYGGQTDWRLPNVKELYSLIDISQYPTLPSEHPFAGVQTALYWSSSSYVPNPILAWEVDTGGGGVYTADKSENSKYVWPVRGGQ